MILPYARSFFSDIRLIVAVVCLSLVCNGAIAAKFQGSFYIGGTTTTFSSPGNLYFDGETDKLVQTNNHFSELTWGAAGAIRSVPPKILQHLLSEYALGPELFYFSTTGTGDVWQYQLPEMNNLTYSIQVESFRLLATNELTFHPLINHVYPFFLWGIGLAVNDASFVEYPRPSYGWSGLAVHSSSHTDFAYTFGGGLKFDISKLVGLNQNKLQLSLRYLYANLGSAEVSNQLNPILIKPLTVNLFTQTWVAGVTCLF